MSDTRKRDRKLVVLQAVVLAATDRHLKPDTKTTTRQRIARFAAQYGGQFAVTAKEIDWILDRPLSDWIFDFEPENNK
jgi:hypothetical protein